jgi:hypothetical protein
VYYEKAEGVWVFRYDAANAACDGATDAVDAWEAVVECEFFLSSLLHFTIEGCAADEVGVECTLLV